MDISDRRIGKGEAANDERIDFFIKVFYYSVRSLSCMKSYEDAECTGIDIVAGNIQVHEILQI